MNQQERNTQFQREARRYYLSLGQGATLREWEALAAFLRRFAEHVVTDVLGLEDKRVPDDVAASIVDTIPPFEEN